MKVNILGTEYEIIKDANNEDYKQLKKCDGFTDFSIKRIVVADFEKDESSIDDLEWYNKKVLRHELVHAFIHESGLAENCDWARNEELTDWIAIQFEKLLSVFMELEVIKIPDNSVSLSLSCKLDGERLKELLNNNINDIVSIGGDG